MKFEVLAAVAMRTRVLWDHGVVAVVYTYSVLQELAAFISVIVLIALKMELLSCSEA